MRNTRIVVASAVSRLAARLNGARPQTSPPAVAAQTESPEQIPNGREREDEWADRPGTALWWSVFRFFMEGFATYGAVAHGVSVEAVLTAARLPHPWSARRTPIAAEHEHDAYPRSENGNVVELDPRCGDSSRPSRGNWQGA
jgi:hypothetical protein